MLLRHLHYLVAIASERPSIGLGTIDCCEAASDSLIRDSGMVLLDAESDPNLAREIRSMVEHEMGARIADLHLWRVGPGHHSLIVSLISPDRTDAEEIKRTLRERHPDLSHVTVEVAVCADCSPAKL